MPNRIYAKSNYLALTAFPKPAKKRDAKERLQKIEANLWYDTRARAQHVFWNIQLLEQVIEDILAEIKYFKSFEFANEAPAL